jgi:hypothetical protein
MPNYCLILCVIVCLAACKEKQEPDDQTGTPVFELTGTVNNSAFRFSGGINHYYMAADHAADNYGVHIFSGEFRKDNCNSCGPSLKLSLRNYTTGFPFIIDSADRPGMYTYYYSIEPVDTDYTVFYRSASTGPGTPDLLWDFADGTTSTLPEMTVRYNQPGIYNVQLTAGYAGGCVSTLPQPVFLTPTRVGKSTDFFVNNITQRRLMFNSIPVDESATVSWDFGDGQSGSGTITDHEYAAAGRYRVCMEMIKGPDTAQFCKNVNTGDFTECRANYTFQSALLIDSLNLSKITIDWKDEAGITYSSSLVRQPQTSFFRIVRAGEYAMNEKGQKTRQLTVEFSCIVSDGTTSLTLNNMKATIAVAYP